MELFAKKENQDEKQNNIKVIQDQCHGLPHGVNKLMERIGDASVVLLGEASHGTHEYYTWRALITQQLIEKKGFNIVGVEGDWPDCYRINRYGRNYENSGKAALDVLNEFHSWPTWM
jgi:erythromycin esterase